MTKFPVYLKTKANLDLSHSSPVFSNTYNLNRGVGMT